MSVEEEAAILEATASASIILEVGVVLADEEVMVEERGESVELENGGALVSLGSLNTSTFIPVVEGEATAADWTADEEEPVEVEVEVTVIVVVNV